MNIEFAALAQGLVPVLLQLGVLLIMLGGFALMFRAGRLFTRLFVLGAVCVALGGLGPATLTNLLEWAGSLPVWISAVVVGFTLLSLFGAFSRLFLSRGAADSMVGNLASGLLRAVFIPIVLPARALRRLLGG